MTASPLLLLAVLAGCSGPSDPPDRSGPDGGTGLGTGSPAEPGPPNVLLLLVDDLGVDKLAPWGLGTDPPPTPVIDGLVAQGMRFEQVWANPVCSPSRAALLTGQHGFRTGVGMAVQPQSDQFSLSTTTWTLPKALAEAPVPYTSVALGKWHLGTWSGDDGRDPLEHGFEHHAGSLANFKQYQAFDGLPQSYVDWELSEDGVRRRTTTYATSHTVDATLAAVSGRAEPWLAWVAFNGVHGPFHTPPPELWSGPEPVDNLERYDAMLEVLDAEIGRLLGGLEPEVRERTVVILLGDNGTPQPAVVPPLPPTQAKGSPYEGGVRVPLLIEGPGVPAGAVTRGLVSHLDLYRTILELGGLEPGHPAWEAGVHSRSLVPLLEDPAGPAVREFAYSERFGPVGFGPREFHERAIREARYKLVTRLDGSRELYDLGGGWLEGEDLLLSPLDPEASDALARLEAALVALDPG